MKKDTCWAKYFVVLATLFLASSYIKLKDDRDFVSVAQSSITLMTRGSASWYEVVRNE